MLALQQDNDIEHHNVLRRRSPPQSRAHPFFLSYVFAQEFKRAPERDLRRGWHIVCARIAVEAVLAGINMDRHLRARPSDRFDIGQRNAGVAVPEMQHGRYLRYFVHATDDLAAVVADRAADILEPR